MTTEAWRLDYATVTATNLHCLCCGWLTPITAALTDWEGSGDALECAWCGAVFEYGQRTGYRLQCGRPIPEGQHNHRRFTASDAAP